MANSKFEATFESLYQHDCPDWFRDAKFGIWSHWGPQSVPMHGDWYARNMYIQGQPAYEHHIRHYGHPSKFGYKDLVQLWKAEKFDPDALMEKYYRAGARYFVAQASHHDHFYNYDSQVNRFNSVQMGPHKDIVQLWHHAAKKYDLPFGITEHIAASFPWWRVNKGCDSYGPYKGVPYDGNDPEYRDFYHDNYEHLNDPEEIWLGMTPNVKFRQHWLDSVKEMVDRFHPEMLYSDSRLPFAATETDPNAPMSEYQLGLEAVAYLYNDSIEQNGSLQAIYTQKDVNEKIYQVGTLDIERSQLPDICPVPWQSETCIGGWFYNSTIQYKTPRHVLDILIDTIAKNGTMLLNIPQLPDGTIDEEADWLLEELAGWFAINSEAVYCTRPWRKSGEGSSKVIIQGFTEEQVPWNDTDFRFVQKDGKLYAFIMDTEPHPHAVIKSLTPEERVTGIRLLGHVEVPYRQLEDGLLIVDLPEKMPSEYACALEISF